MMKIANSVRRPAGEPGNEAILFDLVVETESTLTSSSYLNFK